MFSNIFSYVLPMIFWEAIHFFSKRILDADYREYALEEGWKLTQ